MIKKIKKKTRTSISRICKKCGKKAEKYFRGLYCEECKFCACGNKLTWPRDKRCQECIKKSLLPIIEKCRTCGKIFQGYKQNSKKDSNNKYCSIMCFNRTKSLDDYYFSVIDTPEKAEILGYFFSNSSIDEYNSYVQKIIMKNPTGIEAMK
jgi:hypothetical protein